MDDSLEVEYTEIPQDILKDMDANLALRDWAHEEVLSQSVLKAWQAKKLIEDFSYKKFSSLMPSFIKATTPPAPWRIRKPGDKPCKFKLRSRDLDRLYNTGSYLIIDDVTPQKKFYNNTQANILWQELKEKLGIIYQTEKVK